jgi:hypothetical protein
VLTGEGIEFVHLVRVDDEGESDFQRKVERKQFGGFTKLPRILSPSTQLKVSRRLGNVTPRWAIPPTTLEDVR